MTPVRPGALADPPTTDHTTINPELSGQRGQSTDQTDAGADTPSECGSSSSSSSSGHSSDEDDTESAHATKVQDGIGRLLQLAVRIRREGRKRSNEEASGFEPRDDSGKPLAAEFQRYIDAICTRAFKPGSTNSETGDERFEIASYLKERVNKCMLDRWRRLCYRRHHASDLAGPTQKAAPRTDAQKAKAKPVAPPLVRRDSNRAPVTPTPKLAAPMVESRALSAATSLPEHIRYTHNDLHPKTAPSVTTKVRADSLAFPRPPVTRAGVDVFICNLCGLPCETRLLEEHRSNKSKWKSVHLHRC